MPNKLMNAPAAGVAGKMPAASDQTMLPVHTAGMIPAAPMQSAQDMPIASAPADPAAAGQPQQPSPLIAALQGIASQGAAQKPQQGQTPPWSPVPIQTPQVMAEPVQNPAMDMQYNRKKASLKIPVRY